jgi:hypothetical protein
MSSKTFKATIVRDGSACFIPLRFDPRTVFGKVRAPVRVTLNGYTYRGNDGEGSASRTSANMSRPSSRRRSLTRVRVASKRP